jgi:hypothetical protein
MKRPVMMQQQSFLQESAVQTPLGITVTPAPVNHRAALLEEEARITAQYRQAEPVTLSFDIETAAMLAEDRRYQDTQLGAD